MNKLLIFPLFVLMIITIFSIAGLSMDDPGSGTTEILDGTWQEQPAGSGIYYWIEAGDGDVWGPAINFGTGLYYSPEGPYEESPFYMTNFESGETVYYESLSDFNARKGIVGDSGSWSDLLNTTGFWSFLLLALAGTGAVGVKIFGSGLSTFSQKLIFIGLIWGGVWVFLTINSKDLLMNTDLDPFGWILYTGLTLCFIFGIIMEVQGADGGD